MNPQFNRKRLAVVSGLVILILIFIVLGVIGIIRNLNSNPYGDSTAIKNYDQTIDTLPEDYKHLFTATLHDMIELNYSGELSITSVSDAVIRKDSNKEAVSTEAEHAGSFIVDIASLQQSYLVQYEYSSNPNEAFTSGYPILVSCLETSELIYGDFECKEMYSQNFEELDPIFDVLPYSTLEYQLSANEDSDGDVTILIELYITDADKDNEEAVVELYKSKALAWLKSKDFDSNDYIIEYSY